MSRQSINQMILPLLVLVIFFFFLDKKFPGYALGYPSTGLYAQDNPYVTFLEYPRNVKIRKGEHSIFTCKFRPKDSNLLKSGAYRIAENSCEWHHTHAYISVGNSISSHFKNAKVNIDVGANKSEQICRLELDQSTNLQIFCTIRLFNTGNFASFTDSIDDNSTNYGQDININSQSANITVLNEPGRPQIDMSLASGWIEGDKINISCRTGYGNPPPEITIYLNNKKIVQDRYNELTYQEQDSFNSSSSLTVLHTVTLGDVNGNISCSVYNEAIDSPLFIHVEHSLDVKFAPKLYTNPMADHLSIYHNDELSISCIAIARPKSYNMRWILADGKSGMDATGKTLTEGSGRALTALDLRSDSYKTIVKTLYHLLYKEGAGEGNLETFFETLSGMIKVLELKKVITKADNGKVLQCQASNSLTASSSLTQGSFSSASLKQPTIKSIKIDVLYDPIVTSTPEVNVKEGDTLSITCNIDSNPPPFRITWVKKEREISINYLSTEKKLTIRNISRDQSGTYICRAENQLRLTFGPVVNKFGDYESKVNVQYPPGQPTIKTIQPSPLPSSTSDSMHRHNQDGNIQRIVIAEGDALKLSCGFWDEDKKSGLNRNTIGNPTATFAWAKAIFKKPTDILADSVVRTFLTTQQNNVSTSTTALSETPDHDMLLRNMREINLASGPGFKINSVNEQDIGIYYCTARNDLGSAKRASVMLYIRATPKYVPKKVFSKISDSEIVINASHTPFHLECSFTGRPEPYVVWYKNGIPIHVPPTLYASFNRVAAPSDIYPRSLLNSDRAMEIDNSEFRYKLGHLNTLSSTHDDIDESKRSTDYNYRFDTSSSLGIRYEDKFYLNSTNLQISTQYVTKHTSYLHWLEPLEPTDTGLYTCGAGNEPPNIEATHNLTVKVRHPPIIIRTFTPSKVPTDVENEENFEIQIKCLVFADPPPEFNWRFDNHMLPKDLPGQLNAKYDISVTEIQSESEGGSEGIEKSNSIDRLFKAYESVLTINKLSYADLGTYTCIVNNELGFSELHIELTKKSIPEKPAELYATFVTSNTVSVSCRPGFDGGLPQTINIYYLRVNNNTLPRDIRSSPQQFHSFAAGTKKINNDGDNDLQMLGKYEIVGDSDIQKFITGFSASELQGYAGQEISTPFVKKITLPVKQGTLNFKRTIQSNPDTFRNSYGTADIYASTTDVFFNLEGLQANSKYVFWAEGQNKLGSSPMDYKMLVTTGYKEYVKVDEIPNPISPTLFTLNDTIVFLTPTIDGLCLSLIDHVEQYDMLFECTGLPYEEDIMMHHLENNEMISATKTRLNFIKFAFSQISQNTDGSSKDSIRKNRLEATSITGLGNGGSPSTADLQDGDGLYARLCTVYDLTHCGSYTKINIIGNSKPLKAKQISKISTLTIIVSVIVIMFLLLLGVFVLVCMKRNKDKILKDYEMKNSLHSTRNMGGGDISNKKSSSLQHHSLQKNSFKQNGTLKSEPPGVYHYSSDYNNNNNHHQVDPYSTSNNTYLHNNLQSYKQQNGTLNRNGYGNNNGLGSVGGFDNRGMDMVDEKVTTNETSSYDPNNALQQRQSRDNNNYHQKYFIETSSEDGITGTGKRSVNHHQQHISAPTRFRTPEDLLLAASLEEDDEYDEDDIIVRVGGQENEYFDDFRTTPPTIINNGTGTADVRGDDRQNLQIEINDDSQNHYSLYNSSQGDIKYGPAPLSSQKRETRNNNLQNIHNPNFSVDPSPSPLQGIRGNGPQQQFYDETSNIIHNSISETSSQRVMHEVIV